jgi:hypothetical protein
MTKDKLRRQRDLTPEDRLLLMCCQAVFDGASARSVAALIRGGLDWDKVLELAQRESVIPLLSDRLSTVEPELVPGKTLAEFKRRHIEAAAFGLVLGGELLRVLEVIEARGIRVLTFKGPALAQTAYGNLSSRMFSDVDLIVDDRDFAACQAHLESHNYSLVVDYGFEKGFRRKGSPTMIDVHRRITPRSFPCRLRFDDLSARREMVTLLGAEMPSLSVGDNLLVLSLQVTRGRYENDASLAKLADVAALLHRFPEIDWEALLAEAERVGLTRRLAAVLGAVAELLDAPLPPRVTSLFDNSGLLGRLSQFTGGGVLGRSDGDGLVGFLERVLFHYRVHERKRDKLAQFLMIPSKLQDSWRRRRAGG